jgi:hypothetical protein
MEDKKFLRDFFEENKGNVTPTPEDQVEYWKKQYNKAVNEIVELNKTITTLRSQTEEHQKDLIKKDLYHILDKGEWSYEIDSTSIDDIVDYILERENK